MKKIFFIILITFSIKTQSQNNFGVFGGANINLVNEGFFQSIGENSLGLQIGMLYEVEINDKIFFRPKALLSQQGDTKKTNIDIFRLSSLDYKTTYLNFPLDLKFWNKVYLITGPQIGFLLKTKKISSDYGNLKSNIDFGINIGGGIEINNFFIELGLYQGLTTIYEYQEINGYKHTLKNTHAKLTFGYIL